MDGLMDKSMDWFDGMVMDGYGWKDGMGWMDGWNGMDGMG